MIALLLTLMVYIVIGVGVGIVLYSLEPKKGRSGYRIILSCSIFWPFILFVFFHVWWYR